MSENNLILLNELFTIDEFVKNKSNIANYEKELSYYPLLTQNNFLNYIEKSDNLLNIKIYQSLQLEFVKSYLNDFYDFFVDIFSMNENEEIDNINDSEATKTNKNILYQNRMVYIKQFKESLFNYIIYLKKFKGSFDYIYFIVDLYVRLKYGEQIYTNNDETQDIIYEGNLQVNERYKIYSGKYLNYVKGNIFVADSSVAISGFSVVKQFPIDIFKIDKYSYQISTIIKTEKWENVLKDIVHPLGWNYNFLSLLDTLNIYDKFLGEKDRRTLYFNGNNRVLNANYSLNNTSYFRKINEYGNISLSELGCK